MKKSGLIALAAAFILTPVVANAAQFIDEENAVFDENITSDLFTAGQAINIPAGTSVDGTMFAAGGILDISGNILGDLFLGGDQIKVEGVIDEDVYLVGSSIIVSGQIGDDVHVAGNTVSIESESIDDLFAAGSTVTVAEKTTINGDAYLAGAVVTVSGTINGNAKIAGENIRLTDSAVIKGNLTTYGKKEPSLAAGATIGGAITHKEGTGGKIDQNKIFQLAILNWIRGVVTLFVSAWVLLWLMPQQIARVRKYTLHKTAQSFGLGILWAILFIPAFILLVFTIIGINLGFVALAVSFQAIATALALTPLIVGPWVLDKITKSTTEKLTWQHALVGAVIVKGLHVIPVIGGPIAVLIVMLVFGALLMAMYKQGRE